MSAERKAKLYRMVLEDHTCPFGVRARQMLERRGYEIDEHILSTRQEVETFKADQGVSTTPLIFIGDERIGGSDELEDYLSSRG